MKHCCWSTPYACVRLCPEQPWTQLVLERRLHCVRWSVLYCRREDPIWASKIHEAHSSSNAQSLLLKTHVLCGRESFDDSTMVYGWDFDRITTIASLDLPVMVRCQIRLFVEKYLLFFSLFFNYEFKRIIFRIRYGLFRLMKIQLKSNGVNPSHF